MNHCSLDGPCVGKTLDVTLNTEGRFPHRSLVTEKNVTVLVEQNSQELSDLYRKAANFKLKNCVGGWSQQSCAEKNIMLSRRKKVFYFL